MKVLSGLFPAKVVSYDGPSRLCLVEIDGISTGADQHLEAEIMFPLGDKSHDTEIEILAGDLIWVQFHGGDPRYPIIVGYRTLNEGASIGKRRWHHLNIEIEADEKAEVIVGDTKITSVPDSITMTIGNAMIKAEDGKITLKVGGSEYVMEDEKITEKTKDLQKEAETATISASTSITNDTPIANFTTNVSITGTSTAADHLSSGKSGAGHTHTGNLGVPTSSPL